MPELSHPPGAPSSVAGLLNLAGEAVVVVEAARLFDVAPDADVDPLYRHVLILHDAGETIALLVDRVEDVRDIAADAIVAVEPGHSFNGCVSGEATINGDALHILVPGRILMEAEKTRLSAIREAEQARLDGVSA